MRDQKMIKLLKIKMNKIFLVVALLLLAAGCSKQETQTPKPTPTPTPVETKVNNNQISKTNMSTSLQKDLETTYNNFRKTIADKDYQTFSKLFEPAKESEITEDKFNSAYEFLSDLYPPLDTMKFIKVSQSGAWAGYYVQAELDDPNYTTVDVIKFHKIGDNWKVSGSISGSSFPKDSTTTTIETELKNSEALQLPTK